jgi:hypothetical protein
MTRGAENLAFPITKAADNRITFPKSSTAIKH